MDGSEGSKEMEILPLEECAQKRAYDYVTHHAQGPSEKKDVYPLRPLLTSNTHTPARRHCSNPAALHS